jgi:hypothetical protein
MCGERTGLAVDDAERLVRSSSDGEERSTQ